MASRGARKAAQNKATKAAHAQSRADRHKEWDRQRAEENVGWKDIAQTAAGGIPYVGGVLAAKDIASGAAAAGKAGVKKALSNLSAGSDVGAAGDYVSAAEDTASAFGKTLGKAAGAAASVAGIVGAADAAYGAAQKMNQLQRQNMTDEEYENYKRTGSTTGSRRGRNSRGRKSPMNRLNSGGWEPVDLDRNSPFKAYRFTQPGQDVPIQNYVTLSQRIGDSVNQAVQEQRDRIDRRRAEEDRQMEIARRAQMDEMQKMQLAQLKSNQYETLMVAGDTNIPSADQYLQGASRALVDQQAALVNQLKAGEIDTDQFAQQSALIKSQVPQLEATKTALTGFQENYQSLLEAGELSGANDGQAGQLYSAITSGDMVIEPDENGVMRVRGAQGALDLPLSQIGRIPKPVKKAQPLNLMMKPLAEGMAESPYFGEAQETQVRQQLDNLISDPDDNVNAHKLKAIAVDDLGLSLEKANELYNTPLEDDEYGNTNALERYVEDAMIAETKTQYEAASFIRQKQQAEVEYKRAATERLKREAENSANPRASATAIKSQIERQEMNQNAAIRYNDISKKLVDAKVGATVTLPTGSARLLSNGQWLLYDNKGNPTKQFLDESSLLQAYMSEYDPIAMQHAINNQSPTKRKSPLQRAWDMVTSPFKNTEDENTRNRERVRKLREEKQAYQEKYHDRDYQLKRDEQGKARKEAIFVPQEGGGQDLMSQDDISALPVSTNESPAEGFIEQWYSNPETIKRLQKDYPDLSENEIFEMITRGVHTPTQEWDKESALYDPSTTTSYVPQGQIGGSYDAHERTHATGFDILQGGQIADILGPVKFRDGVGNVSQSKTEYINTPQELGAFIMQSRFDSGLKPGQKVTEEQAQEILDKYSKDNPLLTAIKQEGKVKEFMKVLNTVASAGPEKRENNLESLYSNANTGYA